MAVDAARGLSAAFAEREGKGSVEVWLLRLQVRTKLYGIAAGCSRA